MTTDLANESANQPGVPKATILVIDDSPDSLTLMSGLLKGIYRVKVATHGDTGLKVALSAQPPDLILLDIMMPDVDGYEVCRQLKSNAQSRAIPVIFLTAKSDTEDEQKGLALGAVDYITKPISPAILLARVATQLALKASADFLRDKNDFLAQEVARRTQELSNAQDVTILAMTSLAETRDSDTGNHIRRTQHYVKALAQALKDHPRFADALRGQAIDVLFKSAPLHDIGKVGIPDRILLKPSGLTREEFDIMKTHTTLGFDAIEQAEKTLGTQVPFLKTAKEIALSHQEKWDGSGYPQGLKGDAIPMSARLMAVADVYDALISQRVYKPALPHDRAVQIVFQGRGSHFDPDMVDAFIGIQHEFYAIAQRYKDSDSNLQKKMEYMAYAIADEPSRFLEI
jgi:putative two-component system response regulator